MKPAYGWYEFPRSTKSRKLYSLRYQSVMRLRSLTFARIGSALMRERAENQQVSGERRRTITAGSQTNGG